MPCSIRYHFTQHFSFPAREAYNWCIDYDPKDPALMGEDRAERQVKYLTESTIILTDTFPAESGDVEKQKLVQLYPDRLTRIATHLTGPNKYSQFIYEISPEGENASRLGFTALYLDYTKEVMSEAEVKQLADELRKGDSEGWSLLAKAMSKELGK